MNAPANITNPVLAPHAKATAEVYRWRGHCTDLYARIEGDCVQALDAMIASQRLPTLRRASLFGARLIELRRGLESGKFGKCAKALRALDDLTNILLHRNDIVHGIGKVWIDPAGKWQWQFVYQNNSKNGAMVSGFISCSEAKQMEKELSDGARSVGDLIRNLVKEIRKTSVTE